MCVIICVYSSLLSDSGVAITWQLLLISVTEVYALHASHVAACTMMQLHGSVASLRDVQQRTHCKQCRSTRVVA